MKYTLYCSPQAASDRKIAVATSGSCLKLFKIRYMTFHNRKDYFAYIIETANAGDKYAFQYSVRCLPGWDYVELIRFIDNVDAGKYYASYDYSQRVRKLTMQGVQ